MDLVSTIGESVALGAAGIVFWGEAAYASTNVSTHTPHYIRNSACEGFLLMLVLMIIILLTVLLLINHIQPTVYIRY